MLVSYLTNETYKEFLSIEISCEIKEINLYRGGCTIESRPMPNVHHPSLPSNRIFQAHHDRIDTSCREQLLATIHIKIGCRETHLTPILIATHDATLYRIRIA